MAEVPKAEDGAAKVMESPELVRLPFAVAVYIYDVERHRLSRNPIPLSVYRALSPAT
jgi:hypothetical protein